MIELLEQRDADGELIRKSFPDNGDDGLYEFVKRDDNQVFGAFRSNGHLYILFRQLQKFNRNEHKEKPRSIIEKLQSYSSSVNNCGVVNSSGEIVIPAQYQSIEPFMNDILMVQKHQLYGLIKLSGEIVVDTVYEHIYEHKESLFAVVKDGKVGFMDFSWKVVIPFEYESIDETIFFANGLACVLKQRDDGHALFGYINHKNETVLPFIFRFKVDFIDKDTIENEEREFCRYKDFSEGYINRTYWISIDGTMVMTDCDDSNEIDWNEYNMQTYLPSHSDEGNDPLDAFEGDGDNRWNTD